MYISSLLPTVSHILKIYLFAAFLKGTLLLLRYFEVLYVDNDFVRMSLDFSEILIDPILSSIEYIIPWTMNYNLSLIILISLLLIFYKIVNARRKALLIAQMKKK
jgi:hypothetical protein